jgi:tetratricopeptide (TPR) repeat protein
MRRLYDRAFEILAAEVKRSAQNDIAAEVGQTIVMQRLEKLRRQQGEPLDAEELQQVIADQFPDFKFSILKQAARVNHPPRIGKTALWSGVIVTGLVGLVWIANQPIPWIRRPIYQKMPILLFPSYISMDRNYNNAIAHLEQANQSINQATNQADITSSEEILQQVQIYLDRLPVWFLGNYPSRYCSIITCDWNFTSDEYVAVGKEIERTEARLFQEKNALIQLNEAKSAINTAKQSYQTTQPGIKRQDAMATWQKAVELLQQIPPQTIGGKQAKMQSKTAQKEFEEVVGLSIETQKANSIIAGAQQYAILASRASQNPPHSPEKWLEVIELWENAIERLEQVSQDHPSYWTAQDKLVEYTDNLETIEGRLKDEKEALELLEEAQELITEWREMAQDSDPSIRRLRRKLNQVIYTLEAIEAGTTVTAEAAELLQATRNTRNKL